jgi:hypothetical protein
MKTAMMILNLIVLLMLLPLALPVWTAILLSGLT